MEGKTQPLKKEPMRRMLFYLSGVLFLAANAWMGRQETIGHGGYAFMAVYVATHLLMGGMWLFWPFANRRAALLIVVLAVVSRALWFPFVVSDDVNRYVWEGQIQAHGHNPFEIAPDDEALIPLRDENWEGINHKHLPTVYPPAAQLVFRFCSSLIADGRCHRLLFTLFDLGTLLLLIRLARLYNVHARYLILYALNPVVLLYIAGEGHLDAMPAFFIMAALVARKQEKEGFAFFLLGMGCMFKIVPMLLLPLFARRGNLGRVWLFFVPFLLVIPYALDGTDLTEMPRLFAGTFYYNASVFSLVSMGVSNYAASKICWILFFLIFAMILLVVPDLLRSCFLTLGALLICSPILHPWYFCLIAPFLVFHRSAPWLVLMASACASFTTRIHVVESGEWIDFPLARSLEYGVMLLAWAWVCWKGRETGPATFSPTTGISVIIPTLNEGKNIDGAIESLRQQTKLPDRIIVVDGGSSDDTRQRVEKHEGVTFIDVDPGRGVQIAEGVSRAESDLIVVLHADSRLNPWALESMTQAMIANPSAAGGSFGSTYDTDALKYKFIALLDNVRARFFGISFGNQAQFFRRSALPEGFPAYRLMEDVELAFRMKEAGSALFIPQGVINFPRRWHKKGFFKNTSLVLKLTATYIILRRLGMIQGDLDSFYTRYYGKKGRT